MFLCVICINIYSDEVEFFLHILKQSHIVSCTKGNVAKSSQPCFGHSFILSLNYLNNFIDFHVKIKRTY